MNSEVKFKNQQTWTLQSSWKTPDVGDGHNPFPPVWFIAQGETANLRAQSNIGKVSIKPENGELTKNLA